MSKRTKTTKSVLESDYREKIRSISYIGLKGYTIHKNALENNDLIQLKKELNLQPVTSVSYGAKEKAFPVYRENLEKIYLPRFYGIKRYGLPDRNDLSPGDVINVPFEKPIRDYQEKIIQVYLDHVGKNSGGILEVPCGRGKTVMALKIISVLNKKTLILVHKEFLMNQWIERIREFLPSARVGIIQGQKFEVDNKDIVIGMIQTLYDRPFPNAFTSFGLTIIDEVHRIGSEEFSKTLLKTITPYMLGISATVERKDGLTEILYMFIGEKIYTEERKDDDEVQVRAIKFMDTDAEFNKIEYDFRDNIKYSTMITKIASFQPRSDFIVKILKDLLEDSKQIMVLSHTRALLSYLSEQMHDVETGFYIGGMKADQLRETESKQIVFATYSMAAEALDIKTLNTLVMVTPKTDIIQSVGRILRTKGPGKIIIDVMDTHTVFQNQWKKRKTFYNKCKYPIYYMDSDHYEGMNIETWKVKEKEKEKPVCLISLSNI